MSLEKCRECGEQRSSKAGSCPKCGAVIKRTGLGAKLAVGFLGIAVIGALMGGLGGSSPSPSPVSAGQANDEKKAVELKRYSAAVAAVDALKKRLREPESLKIESLRVNDDASIVCAEYRARNGFGGLDLAFITFVNNIASADLDVWSKRCKVPLHDQLYAVQ